MNPFAFRVITTTSCSVRVTPSALLSEVVGPKLGDLREKVPEISRVCTHYKYR